MKTWLFSLVGVVFIGILLDIILPEGKTNLYIKHIFSIFVIYIILSPLKNVLMNNNNFIESNNNIVDENFLYKNNINKVNALENDIKSCLNNNGVKNANIVIYADIFSKELKINKVSVDLTKASINKNVKDYNSLIIKIINNMLNVDKKEVIIFGK